MRCVKPEDVTWGEEQPCIVVLASGDIETGPSPPQRGKGDANSVVLCLTKKNTPSCCKVRDGDKHGTGPKPVLPGIKRGCLLGFPNCAPTTREGACIDHRAVG